MKCTLKPLFSRSASNIKANIKPPTFARSIKPIRLTRLPDLTLENVSAINRLSVPINQASICGTWLTCTEAGGLRIHGNRVRVMNKSSVRAGLIQGLWGPLSCTNRIIHYIILYYKVCNEFILHSIRIFSLVNMKKIKFRGLVAPGSTLPYIIVSCA